MKQFEFVLDIVLNERLYCAHFSELNDPMEGMYVAVTCFRPFPFPQRSVQHVSSISNLYEHEKYCRICSLSASFGDIRLWSNYADGHRGVVIEVDFEGHEKDVRCIDYLKELEKYGGSTILGGPFPQRILTHKTIHWEYENEFRILHPEAYYPISGRVTAIYLGQKVSEPHQVLLDKVVPEKIPIYWTRVNEANLLVEQSHFMRRHAR